MTVTQDGFLTDKQFDAVRLLAQGLTLDEIGEVMQIAPRTARAHLDAVRVKLHLRYRREIPYTLHQMGYEIFQVAPDK